MYVQTSSIEETTRGDAAAARGDFGGSSRQQRLTHTLERYFKTTGCVFNAEAASLGDVRLFLPLINNE